MDLKDYRVIYSSASLSEKGMMPIGSGEVGMSIWCTKQQIGGYLSRTDSLSETDRLLKLCLFKLTVGSNTFSSESFSQVLDLETGSIRIEGGNAGHKCKVTAIAEHGGEDVLFFVETEDAVSVQAEIVTWRNKVNDSPRDFVWCAEPSGISESADITEQRGETSLIYHRNETDIVGYTAELEGLDANRIPNPIRGRVFGVFCTKKQLSPKQCVIKLSTFSEQIGQSADRAARDELVSTFLNERLAAHLADFDFESAFSRNAVFWREYFSRSYIYVEGDTPDICKTTERVERARYENTEVNDVPSHITRAYLMTKYLFACNMGGRMPMRFNGGHFNLNHSPEPDFFDIPNGSTEAPPESPRIGNSPDERAWGHMMLWQNQRLPYYAILPWNERDILRGFFEQYLGFAEGNRERAKVYFSAEGQFVSETHTSFGLIPAYLYGVDRSDKPLGYAENRYGGTVELSPGLELLNFMLDYCEFYSDTQFLKEKVVSYAEDLLKYVESRFGKESGKFRIGPMHCVETYWDTTDPVTVVAGLRCCLHKLIAFGDILPQARYKAFLQRVPDFLTQEQQGKTVLAPASDYSPERHNVETPQLYAAFPFDCIEEVGKEIMQNTYEIGFVQTNNFQPMRLGEASSAESWAGWHYEPIVGAKLGNTEHCARILRSNAAFQNVNMRCPGMFGPAYDSVPDIDHAATLALLLQTMLLNRNGKKVSVFPAFPANWNVRFRLWLDSDTWIEGSRENGKTKIYCNHPDRYEFSGGQIYEKLC